METNDWIARIKRWAASQRTKDGSAPLHNSTGYYELGERLGQGGMGVVFLARKQPLGIPCAVKFLRIPDEYTANASIPFFRKQIDGLAERFLREARIMGGLEHAGIVKTLDYQACFETDVQGARRAYPSFFLYSMEPCIVTRDGLRRACGRWRTQFPFDDDARWDATHGAVSLQTLLDAGCSFPQETVAHFARELIEVLRSAHGQELDFDGRRVRGIVHRDIKPSNILIGKDGRLKVADFGISKPIGVAGVAAGGQPAAITGRTMSTGTPGYAAPEQANGAAVGPEADYYGLGVVLYRLLAGRRFALGTSDPAWSDPSATGNAPAPISRHWDVLLRGMQEPDPARRLADPDLLLYEFGEIEQGKG